MNSSAIDIYAIGVGPGFLIQHATVSSGVVSAWDSNPGAPPSRPIGHPAAAIHNGRSELVVLAGKTVYYSYSEPGHPWGVWISMGDGNLTAGVSACAFMDDSLEVFGRGPGPAHLVWHSVMNSKTPWGVWESNAGAPPGGLRGTPMVLSRTANEFDLVGQSDADGRLYHKHYSVDDFFSSWAALGDLTDTVEIKASLSSVDVETLDIWARGADGYLRHTSFAGDTPPVGMTPKWDTVMTSPELLLPSTLGLHVIPGLDWRLNAFVRSATSNEVLQIFDLPSPASPLLVHQGE